MIILKIDNLAKKLNKTSAIIKELLKKTKEFIKFSL